MSQAAAKSSAVSPVGGSTPAVASSRAVRGSKGRQTRAAILAAATHQLRDHGYTATTLEQIADRVGITRSAVLHHFGSKAEVLKAIVGPYVADLEELLGLYSVPPALTPRRRRVFLNDLVDVYIERRDVLRLLTHDIAAHVNLAGTSLAQVHDTIVATVAGGSDQPAALIRASAVVGALSNTVLRLGDRIDLTLPAHRQTLLEAVGAIPSR